KSAGPVPSPGQKTPRKQKFFRITPTPKAYQHNGKSPRKTLKTAAFRAGAPAPLIQIFKKRCCRRRMDVLQYIVTKEINDHNILCFWLWRRESGENPELPPQL